MRQGISSNARQGGNMKYRLTIWGIMILSFTSVMLATYGGVQLLTRSERYGLIESKQTKIKELEMKVYKLKQLNEMIPILEQIFTPQMIDELGVLAEKLRQEKRKATK